MAKRPSITNITSGYLSNEQISSNFEAIKTAFDNTISRDGSSPNTVTSNIDMNNKQLINLATPTSNYQAATKKYVDDNTSVTANAIAVAAAAEAVISASSASSSAASAANSALTVSQQVFFPVFSASGLVVSIEAFSIIDATGVAISVSSSSITARASSTQYLVLDIGSKGLKLLDRAYHDGCIPLAKVVTGSSTVSSITRLWQGESPKTYIPRTISKLSTAQTTNQVRIALLGDSLMEPAGSGTKWDALLFDTGQVASGYNITGAGYVQKDVYAVGGSTTAYGICLVGEGSHPGDGAYANTALAVARAEGTKRFSPPKTNVGRSPLLTDPYDLAIIGYGANGGTFDLLLLENIVSALREVGTEVILVTSNYRSDNADFLKTRSDYLRKIAINHGCALVDTWMYVLEKSRAGYTVHADTVHMAADGHKAWAEALYGVLSPAFYPYSKPNVVSTGRAFGAQYESNSTEWIKYPNSCQIQFTPSSTDGTANQTTTATTALLNPAILFGGKTSSTAVTTLANTKKASFAHPWATNVDLLVDGSSSFTAAIKTQSEGTTLATVSFTSSTTGRVEVVEGTGAGTYADVTDVFRYNRGIQIVVTSGTCKLIGVIFHCDKMKELDLVREVTYTGTWSTEAWINSHPISYYTDTDGDYCTFDFEGTEAIAYLSSRGSSGKVDVFINGKKIISQQDLYISGGSYLAPIRIPSAYSLTDYRNKNKGKNTVQIKLNGANGSSGSAGSGNRKLGLLAVHVFDKGNTNA